MTKPHSEEALDTAPLPGGYLQTGQRRCYDAAGRIIPCAGTGQDGELRRGIAAPEPRFLGQGDVVLDQLTGLTWSRNANPAEFPLTWQEALDVVFELNDRQAFGRGDWRLPSRREMRSLLHFETRKPALPPGHPFTEVFLGWYWTSTTAAINPAYAWYVHLEGARMFYGRKDQYYLLWPVAGPSNGVLPATGQTGCFDAAGAPVPCRHTGQDGELQTGLAWPRPRFKAKADTVRDQVTGLRWLRRASLSAQPVSWPEAFRLVENLRRESPYAWRLPNINELESLVDCSRYAPALPPDQPFTEVQEVYWSSTTSFFEPDWAWALYLVKGATGVGVKTGETFHVWPVAEE